MGHVLPPHVPATSGECDVGTRVPGFQPLPRNITENFVSFTLHVYSPWEILLKVVAYVAIIIIALVGNSLVIYVVARFPRMRTVTNVYLVNLSVSGLLLAVFCSWVHLGSNIYPEWPFNRAACKAMPFINCWSLTVGVFTMTVVAAKRFFIIVYPLKARLTSGYSEITLVAIWVAACAFAAPNLLHWEVYEIYWKNRREVWCEETWPRFYYLSQDGTCETRAPGQQQYITVYVALAYFLPVVAMTTTYFLIMKSLWHRHMGIQHGSEPLKHSVMHIHKKTRKRVVRMLIVVLVAYVVCWTPFVCFHIADSYFTVSVTASVIHTRYAVTFLAYTNCALNPILYASLSTNFRQAFRAVLLRQKPNTQVAPEPRTAISVHAPETSRVDWRQRAHTARHLVAVDGNGRNVTFHVTVGNNDLSVVGHI